MPKMQETTLCYIEREGKYLMLRRSPEKQDGSAGKWQGIGGKLEPGEEPDDCILREALEETGLTLTRFCRRGTIYYYSNTWESEVMYLYSADAFEGELRSDCEEGELQWIPEEEIMGLNLWEGDRFFLKKLMAGEKDIQMTFAYEGDFVCFCREGLLTEGEVEAARAKEDIVYTDEMTGEEYNALRESVKWNRLTEGQAGRGLQHTTFLVVARYQGEAVGMGRILFDYGYTAYLGDVIVSPRFQGRGIGTAIVQRLMRQVREAAEPGDRIMFLLGSAKGREPFYEKLGFKKRPDDFCGHGMTRWIKIQ